MHFNIALIPGDGIGPEVIEQTIFVLKRIGKKYGHVFTFRKVLAGGCAIEAKGTPLPDESLETCKNSDSVLLGAVGGPEWDHLRGNMRPERALLGLRKELGLYANIRPAILYDALKAASPLRPDIVAGGIDICIVRELTGGIYFGAQGRGEGELGEEAFDTEIYSEREVDRIARTAFGIAMKRQKKLRVLTRQMYWKAPGCGARS